MCSSDLLLDVRTGHRRAAVSRAGILLGLPEGPDGAVNAAVGAGSGSVGHGSRQAGDVLPRVAGSVAVDVGGVEDVPQFVAGSHDISLDSSAGEVMVGLRWLKS